MSVEWPKGLDESAKSSVTPDAKQIRLGLLSSSSGGIICGRLVTVRIGTEFSCVMFTGIRDPSG